jgi:hypothetical protein
MSSLICNELLHDTITYGLIPVYRTLNTISPPKVVTQLPKPNKDLSHVEIHRLSAPLSQQPVHPSGGLPLLVKLNLETLLLVEELGLRLRPPLQLLK